MERSLLESRPTAARVPAPRSGLSGEVAKHFSIAAGCAEVQESSTVISALAPQLPEPTRAVAPRRRTGKGLHREEDEPGPSAVGKNSREGTVRHRHGPWPHPPGGPPLSQGG